MNLYHAEVLREYAGALLIAGGFSSVHAANTADVLVWANTRGVDSHGVLRIPRYIEMVEQGAINPAAVPAIVRRFGAVSILEADRAPGASAMIAAMDEAVDDASRHGIGWCSARGITHAGAVGYYALRATRRDLIGIVMTASGPLMAYYGSRKAGVSTNPISIAVPTLGDPILLDMSTSTAALGKVLAAKDAGRAIPDNWGIDAFGRPTTDPGAVKILSPLGGPKGSGLSLMIEILSSVLIANPAIAPALKGRKAGMNGVALAITVDAFGNISAFRDEVARLEEAIHALPPAEGMDAIRLPGERGNHVAAERIRSGIPLAGGTVERLAVLGKRLGVQPPTPLKEYTRGTSDHRTEGSLGEENQFEERAD